jgi:hypothetical protein
VAPQQLPAIKILEKKPVAQEQRAAAATPTKMMPLNRSLNYVVEKLPSPVSGRVQPLYQSYAQPAVAKVDGALMTVADKGSQLLGGTRARLFKVKSAEGLDKMGRGGMLSRAVDAIERTLDHYLPPTTRAGAAAATGGEGELYSDASSEEEERSSLGRMVGLVGETRNRLRVHAEVKFIVMKVNLKVWCDLNVVPPYQKAKGRALALKTGTQNRVRRTQNTLLALKNRTERTVASKYHSVRSFVAARVAMVLKGIRAVQKALLDRTLALKKGIENRARPVAKAVQVRMQPLTDRMGLAAQSVKAAERRCVVYVLDRKAMVADKATRRTAMARKCVADTYGAAMSGVTARATGTANYLAATADTVLSRALGKDRSAKVQGTLLRYATVLSRSVQAQA